MEEIPLEHAIYIRLDIDNSEFHEEAINILKEKHEVCINTCFKKIKIYFIYFIFYIFYYFIYFRKSHYQHQY